VVVDVGDRWRRRKRDKEEMRGQQVESHVSFQIINHTTTLRKPFRRYLKSVCLVIIIEVENSI
jgi:hypothetical protein